MPRQTVMTTDERFQKVGDNEWWDTTGIDIVPEAEVDHHIAANPGVGVMVVESDDENAPEAVGWFVELEGDRKRLGTVRSPEVRLMVEPLVSTVTKALGQAPDQEELAGLNIIVFAEPDGWGFRLEGPADAVSHAMSLLGPEVPLLASIH